jgi:hypothetical protein
LAGQSKEAQSLAGCPRICGLTKSIVPAEGLRSGEPGARSVAGFRVFLSSGWSIYAADATRPVRLNVSPERIIW